MHNDCLLPLLLLILVSVAVNGYSHTISIRRIASSSSIVRRRLPQLTTLTSTTTSSASVSPAEETKPSQSDLDRLYSKLDREIFSVALPAFFSLAADPLASIVDTIFVGRLGALQQAAMGISISAQYSISKLYNDPLLKTSTSIVAGKSGEELEASVATCIATAIVIGTLQMLLFLFVGGPIMKVMGVGPLSEMRQPALSYLRWRAIGIPAQTVLLVVNGIFRGRGDTKTPFYCTVLGSVINIVLDPLFIFTLKMGCAGAGIATSISQWVCAVPLLLLLNKTVPIKILGRDKEFYRSAYTAYLEAGGLLLLRTVAKIGAYAFTSSAAARLGTIAMAAYSVTFNLGFATSQLCESISIAAQALLARDYPYETIEKKYSAGHIIRRSLWLGVIISAVLSCATIYNQNKVLKQLTKSAEVFAAAKSIMPIVLVTQLAKGLAYSTGGILLGGLDWLWSSLSMQVASIACIGTIFLLPRSLSSIWIGLANFMGFQVRSDILNL